MWAIGDAPGTTKKDLFQARYRGMRVSFGYPACPRLEDQAELFRLLGVTEAIGHLHAAGLILCRRSLIAVLDRPRLEARVCECYAIVRRAYDRLVPGCRRAEDVS